MRKEKFLSIYAGVVTAVLTFVLLVAAKPSAVASFDELNVQRINIKEANGTLRMVISNKARLPGVIANGKETKIDRPQAGMIFYNDEGSENGGLIFGGRRNDKGQVVDSGGSLSFDKYGANQIIQLAGVEDSSDRFAGLAVLDSPSGTEVHRRIWVGRGDDNAATIALMDARGKRRIVMQVPPDGAPSLTFLDANGKVLTDLAPK